MDYLACHRRGNTARVQRRRQFIHITRYHPALPGNFVHGGKQFQKLTPPASGVPVPGEHRRIKHVQIQRKIDGNPSSAASVSERPERKTLHPGAARLGPPEFLLVAGTNPKLKDSPVSQKFPTAPNHAGMREPNAEIIVPQVGVCVQVDNPQRRKTPDSCAHCAERDQVLPAQQERQLPVCKISSARAVIASSAALNCPLAIQVTTVKYGAV